MPPKILFLTRSLDFGGAQRQLVELAIGLHRAGWDVKVVTFYDDGALADRLRDEGMNTISIGKAGRGDVFPFAWRLIKLLHRERPDIAHGYLDSANILLTVLRWCIPRSRIVWGVRASNMSAGKYDALFRLECRISALLSRFADLIICNSHAGRAHHAATGYPDRNMVVIPNGIDLKRFRPDANARAEVRAEWGIEKNERLIGLVGRLDPMKDQSTFLTAAASLLSTRRDLRFACVGDGPRHYRESLKELSHRLGIAKHVIWSDARTDVWRVQNALDIAVSASSFGEGFSNSIAEAMATGIPCVVTDVGDSAALVGDLGWVCPPNDSGALAHAISQALSALPIDAARLREHISTNYSAAELSRRTISALSCLLEPRLAPSSAHKSR